MCTYYQSTNVHIYIPTYIHTYIHTYLQAAHAINLIFLETWPSSSRPQAPHAHTGQCHLPTYLPAYLPTYQLTYLPTYPHRVCRTSLGDLALSPPHYPLSSLPPSSSSSSSSFSLALQPTYHDDDGLPVLHAMYDEGGDDRS